jgi:hypothetical protein
LVLLFFKVVLTVTWPAPVSVTGSWADATGRSSSGNSTATSTVPAGTMAASTVASIMTCLTVASSTFTGLANRPARKSCGTEDTAGTVRKQAGLRETDRR